MRIAHTSDWHLGRSFHGVGMLEYQAAFLDHLVDLVRGERLDAVLMAGDVYDRAIPPVQAVELLGDTLRRLTELTQVVVISGNHDSATRLGFASELMNSNLHIRARTSLSGVPVTLRAGSEAVRVYPIPYLDPDSARIALGTPDGPLARSHEAVLSEAVSRVRADAAARSHEPPPTATVVMAHAFVVGGTASESERDIAVGGVDGAPAGIFDGFDYVALGHLHSPQQVSVPDDSTLARYSGSPLAYSFSEKSGEKSTAILSFSESSVPEVELIPAPVPRPLAELEDTFDRLLGPEYEKYRHHWLSIRVTDPERPRDLISRIKDAFPHELMIQHVPPERETSSPLVLVTSASDPLEVAEEFVDYAGGRPALDAEVGALRHSLEFVLASDRENEVGLPSTASPAGE